ncbi:MAG: hypothetical protein SPK85_04925 [Prevotella sp.]|nr:hypothetical protein [Prevotella sp.]
MNTQHNDINKFIPFGESLRGFANQRFISQADIHRILKERGVFTLNQEKDYTVPILQTLLLSPREFDKIRDAFSSKEDNEKSFSRDIVWNLNIQIFQTDLLSVDVDTFIKRNLPTCKLGKLIRFEKYDNNPNHLIAQFTIERHDINKSWYEQTNVFQGSVEFVNENGKGHLRITHTAPETKMLAEEIAKQQIERYKKNGSIPTNEVPKKIIFSDFRNEDRFAFFYRLTTRLENEMFTCESIKDISIKPQENCVLPNGIEWMNQMKKILISGDALDKTFFMKETKFHRSLVLWNVAAQFSYQYKGEEGEMTVNLGFPDYNKKGDSAEFEMNICPLRNRRALDSKNKKKLIAQLLSELDKQKSIVYNNFLNYLMNKKR